MSADGSPIPIGWVVDLFVRLTAIVGAGAMDAVYAGVSPERVKAEWAEALAGFSSDEVQRGLASVRLRKFAPNLPDFLHLCRPALDSEVAWNEAYDALRAKGRAAWSHPAVYWAACDMGYELRNGTYAQHRKRWDALMARQWLAGRWEAVPSALAFTPAKQADLDGVPKSRDEVSAMLKATSERLKRGASSVAAPPAPIGSTVVTYTDAELADMRRAKQLQESGQ